MSTPTPEDPRQDPNTTDGDHSPPVPGPPQFGQRRPEDGPGASGLPQYGQNAPGQQSQGQYGQGAYGQGQYGQPGQPNLPPAGQGYSNPMPSPYGYGQQPVGGVPGFGSDPGAKPAAPKQITIAFWLIMAAGLLTLVQGLLLLLIPNAVILESLNQGIAMQGAEEQQELADAGFEMSSMIMPFKIIGLVMMVIGAGIYALIAGFIRKGSKGARITGTVLAAISLIGLFASDPLLLVAIVLGVAGIVFAWLTPSSQYINEMARRKRSGMNR